jgi:hypothetical protein
MADNMHAREGKASNPEPELSFSHPAIFDCRIPKFEVE